MNKFFGLGKYKLFSDDIKRIASVEAYQKCDSVEIFSLGDLRNNKEGDIVYLDGVGASSELSRDKYMAYISELKASAIIVRDSNKDLFKDTNIAVFISESPKKSFIKLQEHFVQDLSLVEKSISERSFVDSSVEFVEKDSVAIGHFSVIEKNVKIGKNVVIGNNVVIGAGVEIGDGSIIRDGATIRYSILGNYCVIDEGARLGTVGFGWASDARGHVRVIHTGSVILGDFVEIGANTCIDRGVFEDSKISDGVKIDNLCQIAHNVNIGKHSILAGGCCIAGSVEMGSFVLVGGNTAISGHLKIEDGANIGGMSGVIGNVSSGSSVWGLPATNKRDYLRQTAALRGLIKRKK
ncbi:MAG: UDP-3-O-(3-hydroxymyristoyl)glucosamine N-acyltransferase [Alphaproteobacteria bacterium]|jgi:UDP-3-O-[3-hydroxymyristoyl] glucosamine N-acyltransferase|nr:UDP-3-O-(3-hydroxymyristoyl)glucosamine N-acyltransferase [Alphaproteobacteria bacterium]